MTLDQFRIESLDKHDRKKFDCGVEPLNDYFRNRVGQDIRRRFTTCYLAVDKDTEEVAAYYTLSAGSVDLGQLPKDIAKRLPRYPSVPVARVGRLAIDKRYRGIKLGSVMLFDAIKRAVRSEFGVYAILVDAKGEDAISFYRHHHFMSLANTPSTLFLPVSDGLKNLIYREP